MLSFQNRSFTTVTYLEVTFHARCACVLCLRMLKCSIAKHAYDLQSTSSLFGNLLKTIPYLRGVCLWVPANVDSLVTFRFISFGPYCCFPPGMEDIGITSTVNDVLLLIADSLKLITWRTWFIRDGANRHVITVAKVVAWRIIAVNWYHLS